MTTEADEPTKIDDAAVAAGIAAGIGLAMVVVALAFWGGRTAASVGVGAAIAVSNLLAMRATIRALLNPPTDAEGGGDHEAKRAGRRGGAAWAVFAVLKMVILFGGIWILLTHGLVDPIPLVVGYMVLPLGITALALRSSLSPGRP